MEEEKQLKDFDKDFESICIEIENGTPLRKACPPVMSLEKFYKLINESELKAKRYAHACEGRAEKIFEEILTISDGGEFDEAINVQRDRLKVDARKWVLAKLAPKKYGDKMEVDNTHTINSVSLKELVNFK